MKEKAEIRTRFESQEPKSPPALWATGAATIRFITAAAVATLTLAGSTQAAVVKKPTFTEHVAPIVFQHCAACHRPGEIGPFPLLTYQDVRKRSKLIAEVTGTKFMPPWHAEMGHVEYQHPLVLSPDEIATLKRWHETGSPEGNPKKLPKLPAFPEGWQYGKPDLVLKMDRPFKFYAEGRDIYRNFVFPLNLPEDKYVRAIEFRPKARTIVHHALFFLDTSGAARQADEADPEPGYDDHGEANRRFTPVGGWAVGSNVRVLPDGLAYHYPKDADLVVQTHFHPTGKAEEEMTTIGLYFADKPKRSFVGLQLPPAFGQITGIDIPAGETNYIIRDSITLPVDVEAFSIAAHAHYLGKVMTMTATLPDGREQVLLKIPDWDFAWQEQYAFKDRVKLPKGTRLESVMSYDNSVTNPRNPTSPAVRVTWGPMSTDEMGSINLQVVAAREEDTETLRNAIRDHASDLVIDKASSQSRQGGMVKAMFERFDKNKDGKLDTDERPALRSFIKSSGWLPGALNNSF